PTFSTISSWDENSSTKDTYFSYFFSIVVSTSKLVLTVPAFSNLLMVLRKSLLPIKYFIVFYSTIFTLFKIIYILFFIICVILFYCHYWILNQLYFFLMDLFHFMKLKALPLSKYRY